MGEGKKDQRGEETCGKMTSMGFIQKLFIKRGSYFGGVFYFRGFAIKIDETYAYCQVQLRNILQHHSIHEHMGFATTIGETQCACKHRSSHPSHGHACIHPPQVPLLELTKQARLIFYFNGKKLNAIVRLQLNQG